MNRFYAFTKESLKGAYGRAEAAGLRAGNRVLRADRFQPYVKGAAGSLDLEVLDSGFGFWLPHMLGQATAGTVASGITPWTATVADLRGKSFTAQVARWSTDGALNPFTYTGGKIKSWELSNQVDGVLQASLDFDFTSEHIPAAGDVAPFTLATPTYPAAKLLTFVGGSVQVDGTAFFASDISVKGETNLNDSRWAVGPVKREPLEQDLRKYTFTLKGEFDSLAQYKKVASATAAGALANIVLNWTGVPNGAAVPYLQVTMPLARLDDAAINVDGQKVIPQTLAGEALTDDVQSAITIVYGTADTAL